MDRQQPKKRDHHQWISGGVQHAASAAARRWSGTTGPVAEAAALPFARTERYGMLILLGLLFLLPVLARDLGFRTDLFSQVVTRPSEAIIHWITRLEGNL
jgi:hypothetical protein